MDSLKKVEDFGLKIEGLFDRVFGHKSPTINILQKNNKGNYYINGNFVYGFGTDGSLDPYSESTWEMEKFKWLIDAKFEAKYIYIKNEEIQFDGNWYNGEFKGLNFWGANSFFMGGFFNGKIYAADNIIDEKGSFQIHPNKFIDGVYVDYENGILGRRNYKIPLENQSVVDLISIPLNSWVLLTGGKSDRNKKVYFRVIKKLDDKNSDFTFQVTSGFSNFRKFENKLVKWANIRIDYENMSLIKVGQPFVLLGDENYLSKINSIVLTNEQPNIKVVDKNIIDFSVDNNLKKIFSFNGITYKFEVETGNAENMQKINELQKIIVNGKLYEDLKLLKFHVEPKKDADGNIQQTIDGYENEDLIYLKPLFNYNKGKKTLTSVGVGKELQRIMKELNDIIEILSINTKRLIEENNKANEFLIGALKKYLGIDKFINKPNIQPNQQNINKKNQQITKLNKI